MVLFVVDFLRRDGCVGVGVCYVDMVGLYNFGYFIVDVQDGQAFFVGIREGGFELFVGCGQFLDRDGDVEVQ